MGWTPGRNPPHCIDLYRLAEIRMDALAVGLMAFASLFGAGFVANAAHGRLVGTMLPGRTVRVIQRSVGLVAVLSIIVLALLTVSLSGLFGSADRDVKRFSAEVTELDRTLRRDGPAAAQARELLFRYTARTMRDVWPQAQAPLGPDDAHADILLGQLTDAVNALPTATPAQQTAAQDAQRLLADVIRTRWSMNELNGGLISPWLVLLILCGLVISFAAMGLWAPRTPAVTATLFLCAVAVAGTVYMLAEFDYPYTGIIIVSAEPMQNALFTMAE
jgi:hypothetical protein